MGKKFDEIFEAVSSRNEVGGYLPGDLVVLRSNYKSCDAYKLMPSDLQQELDYLSTCGLNIKIVEIKNNFSNSYSDNQGRTNLNNVFVIAADQGGGRTYCRVSVTPDMIELAQQGLFSSAPVPDKFKRKDKVIIKPIPVKVDNNLVNRTTDKGNGKNTPTDLKLAGESAKPWESTKELALIYESDRFGKKKEQVSQKEREAITDALVQNGFDGNGRFESPTKAISIISGVLDGLGYSLDAVMNDVEIPRAHHQPGSKGQKLLTYRRVNLSEDPFNEEPEIENSRIVFAYEDLGRGDQPKFEVIAYAS